MDEIDFVTFNVIGSKFLLRKDLFKSYPNSLFHQLTHNADQYVCLPKCTVKLGSNQFYVQRSPDLFKIVVQYLINGQLHVPNWSCRDEILDEFSFWNITPTTVCQNCADLYSSDTESKDQVFDKVILEISKKSSLNVKRRKLWTLIEHPTSSIPAMIFAIFSLLFISLSILNIIFSSIPELQFCSDGKNNSTIGDTEEDKKYDLENGLMFTDCIGSNIILIIDMICVVWFTVELILRLGACPSTKKFFTYPMNIVDILSVLPFYIELLLFLIDSDKGELHKARAILMFMRILRIIRIFRIFKLARYVSSLRILGSSIKSALKELNMLFLFIILATFICANFLYQLEKDEQGTSFTSIPASFWWCIVTLTTVGYGDMVPQTVGGKLFGSMTCVCGIIVVALPVAVLVEKFLLVYRKHEQKKSSQCSVNGVQYRDESFRNDVTLA